MKKTDYTLQILSGTGMQENPFSLGGTGRLTSNRVTGFMRDHISQIASDRNWQNMQIIDYQFHTTQLSHLAVYEINYDAMEDGQLEYFSVLVWYDITQPWTSIEAGNSAIH